MKILIVLLNFLCVVAMGQVAIRPTITMPANPPANVADWRSMQPLMISAMIQQGTPNDIKPDECKMVISIKSDGKPVCGIYNPDKAPYFRFSGIVMNINKEEILSHLGECVLKPGQYELCVEFFGFNRLMGASCKPFTISDNKPENYTPPSLISPAEGKVLSEAEQKQPLTFRWTPLVPKPRESVTYRVVVLEAKKGQTATEARNLGNKVYENKVENQTQLTVNGLGALPIAKDSKYAWYVEALGGKGNLLGSSEVAAFSVNSAGCGSIRDSIRVVCGEVINGKPSYLVSVSFKNIIPSSGGQQCTTQMNNISSSTGLISGITTLPVTVPIGGTSSTVTFIYTPSTIGATTVSFLYKGNWNDGYSNSTNFGKDNIPLPNCRCTTCDQVSWKLPETIKRDSTITNNLLTLSGNINFGPQKVVKLSAEIVDFYWFVEGDCKKSNNNGYYFGNLASGNIAGFTSTNVAEESGIPLTNSRQIDFVSSTLNGLSLNGNINLNISLPPQTILSCCTDCFRFCIRYTATFMENGACKTCSIVKCYETKRKHRPVGDQLYYPMNQCGDPIRIDVRDYQILDKN